MNPFKQEFTTPFKTIPFDKIKNEHFLDALKDGIAESKECVEKVKKNSEAPSLKNTLEVLEREVSKLDIVAGAFYNLMSADTNDELQKIAKEFSPLLTKHSNDIMLDAELFTKIKSVYDNREQFDLSSEDMTLLEKNYRDFVRNGALLDEEGKNRLRDIDENLSKLTLDFSENLLKETNGYELIIESEDDLSGLPKEIKEAAANAAKEKEYSGSWLFTLHYPSFGPFIKYSDKRELREEIYKAFSSRCNKDGELDNRPIILETVRLRHERANLLGYKTHADFVLAERMAKKVEEVDSFLNNLFDAATEFNKKDVAEVQSFALTLAGPEQLEKWDYLYYSEKLKKEKYGVDDSILKPYFELNSTLKGAFKVANKLYGLEFEERADIPVYHQDVKVFEVKDDRQKHIGLLYTDFFARPSKSGGAWMTSYKEQYKSFEGINERPHISIVCNFSGPTDSEPTLLTLNETLTLFHEFGHALHGLLADVSYKALSGANVFWDFVELPSQIMENWVYEKECLDLFAKHYQTGELLSEDLITKVKNSSNFQEGKATLRQIGLARIDMSWHSQDPNSINDVSSFEQQALKETDLLPEVLGSSVSTGFAHIFAGGYSSGYYSYKWAEVLDADAFAYFKENGIFNKEIAKSFRDNVLSKGATEDPMELYKKFRGAVPKVDALLKRSGLIS